MRAHGRGGLGGAALAGALLAGSLGAGCKFVDYFYRHAVSGRVVDAAGRPVAGAVVARVDPATGEVAGLQSLYRRVTAADGTFRFEYSGLGPKPQAAHTWYLAASKPGYRTATRTLRVPWMKGKKAPLGYTLKGVVLRLAPTRRGPRPADAAARRGAGAVPRQRRDNR